MSLYTPEVSACRHAREFTHRSWLFIKLLIKIISIDILKINKRYLSTQPLIATKKRTKKKE